MTTRHLVDSNGAFLGSYGPDTETPEGAIEVPEAPDHAGKIWRDGAWQWSVAAAASVAKDAIQELIDGQARARMYDSGVSLATYVASPNPAWSAEAQAFINWRDAVWMYVYQQLALVQSGQRPMPTLEALLVELPDLTWPA